MIEKLLDNYFKWFDPIDGNRIVHIAKLVIGMQTDSETSRIVMRSTADAALEPGSNIVKHFLIVNDQRGTYQIIVENICSRTKR